MIEQLEARRTHMMLVFGKMLPFGISLSSVVPPLIIPVTAGLGSPIHHPCHRGFHAYT